MESDQSAGVKEVNGINLANYFPHQSSFNTVVYVHKRFLKKRKDAKKEENVKNKREKKKKTVKEDKAINCNIKDSKTKKDSRNESVLQQTIKFAKNLVPLVIPPSEGNSPVFYTIKTCNRCKKNDHLEAKCDKLDDVTFEKKKSKKLIETFKKEKKNHRESYSGRYSATQSSQSNTLDDINMNQFSCTLSDLSDKRDKYHKNAANYRRKRLDSDKLGISESYEALATELNDIGETKIKIHLMNDKEKHFLSDSIRIPVLDAVKDCIKEFNNSEMSEEVKSVQRFVKCNSHKLDTILDKLTCIEKHLANISARTVNSPKAKPLKVSRLEQLGEDLMEEKEYSSEEELPKLDSNRQRNEVALVHGDIGSDDLGCGEIQGAKASTSVGVRTDRHRLPARFCWTDAARKN